MPFCPCIVLVFSMVSMLTGCSPEFNWREVRPVSTRLQALMPCKPDEAMRTVRLDGRPVEMRLAGCDAGGATFVIGWAPVPADRIGAALGSWQDETLSRAGIPAGPDAPAGHGFAIAGSARPLPQSRRIRAQGRAPDGGMLLLEAAWFEAAGDTGPQAGFAAVYRQPHAVDAGDTFFSSLRLR